MNTAIVMLGSNSNPDKNIDLAKDKISEYYEIISSSEQITTKPYGKHYKYDFQNAAIKILSDDTAEETRKTFKLIEKDLGRIPTSKKEGIIPIDIDLIFWNETLVHKDYERFDFVKKCVNELM